jgi:hypothetical protein
MDTITRIAELLRTTEVVAVRVTQLFDLPWSEMSDEMLLFRLRIAMVELKK